MKKNYYFLIALIFSATGHSLESQTATTISETKLANIVSTYLNEMLQQPDINSASIAVTYNGIKHIAHGGELTKGEGDTPIDTTIYEIGSGSKTFPGVLVAQAVLDGKLSLDDRVSQYLPSGFTGFGTNDEPITVKHLLTHTSGLPNMLPSEANDLLESFTDKRTPERLNTVIKTYTKSQFLVDLKALKLQQVPGKTYSYSSAGTELLAYVLEQIHGESYAQILDRFTSKLKMTHTKISLSKQEQSQLATGYHLDNLEPAAPMSTLLWGAAGNMKSTATDILNYLEFQLDKDNLVARQSHKTLYATPNGDRIAYKWNVSDEGFFGDSLHHHGGVPSTQNYMMVAPEKNFGLFVITNQSGTTTPTVLRNALNGIMADIKRLQTQQ